MDKSWIEASRVSPEYLNGARLFIEFALTNASINGRILCPCKKCSNGLRHIKEDVFDHIICNGFLRSYTHWFYHGESLLSSTSTSENQVHDGHDRHDDMHGMLHDVYGSPNMDNQSGDHEDESRKGPNADAENFFKMLKDAEQELYPGCKKFSKLSFVVRLFHIKCLNGWSNKSFTMLLELLKEALPDGETLPASFYETKKIIAELGLHYNKIDACPNDCMLYWKEFANVSSCAICGASRWKTAEQHADDESTTTSLKNRNIPVKILRHFPLKPRLQRLFMSSKTASFMKWHHECRTKDGILRHPADSQAWRSFDNLYTSFFTDPRNVRLGLASDGFNPFRTMSIAHSTWPVVLMPYNLPPWMCMKQPYILLSLLIPGPTGPGNNIDVYLQPLIDELKELWEDGVDTYDSSSNQTFQMRAALLWTINDFPAYANLSGWSTKGRFACPSCNKDTCSHYLKYGRKFCYMGHRRFLEHNHRFRKNKKSFDGNHELRSAPTQLSGFDVLDQLHGFNVTFGKKICDKTRKKRGRDDTIQLPYNWKKRSIFFDLPYWKTNLLRNNLDVMHIEKNVCDSLVGTLLNIDGKTKDNVKARLDLQVMGLRKELHPKKLGGNKTFLPSACFSMTSKEKDIFCKVLKQVKVPDGYASNISRCVHLKDRKISGLKSHDCHILMQQLLPLAMRKCLPKKVSSILIELCFFFKELCSKVSRVSDFERLESRIALTLCHLEKIFPPAFFDIMMHLPIHLSSEARIAGPVQYRWMYPIERYLFTLKSYVRNRSHPEGSIAEGYLAEECLTFCSRYLQGVENKFNRPTRNHEESDADSKKGFSIFSQNGRGLGKHMAFALDNITWIQAHRYVLFNCDEVGPFIEKYRDEIKKQHRRLTEMEAQRILNEKFHIWFKDHVEQLQKERIDEVSKELRRLSWGPNNLAKKFSGYLINGLRFHTKDREIKRKTQNSGVVVVANTPSFSSARDRNPVSGDVTYYGVLTDIIELDYYENVKVVLFKADWVDVNNGVKKDEFGFTEVNLRKLISTGQQLVDEPFVLANQVEQVFYVQDPIERDWHVAIKTKARDLYDLHADGVIEDIDIYPGDTFSAPNLEGVIFDDDDDSTWIRSEVPGTTVDTPPLFTHIVEDVSVDDTESDNGYEEC